MSCVVLVDYKARNLKIAAYNALNIKVNRRVDECLKVYTLRNYKYQHKQFQNQFQIENNNFEMPYGLFVSKYKQIIKNLCLIGKTSPSTKTEIMQEFSFERWCGLTIEQKQSHRISCTTSKHSNQHFYQNLLFYILFDTNSCRIFM